MAVPTPNKVYVDALTSPSWVPDGDGFIMNLGDGFAKLGPGGMYAERVISALGASDVANITGLDELDAGNEIGVSYSAKESKISFTTGKATYVLDGKKDPKLYSDVLNYLFEDALVGLAGGETTPFEKKSGHGTLYKGAVILLTAATVLGLGCVAPGDNVTKEKPTPVDTAKDTTPVATDAPVQTGDAHIQKDILGYKAVGDFENGMYKVVQPDNRIGGGADAAGMLEGNLAIVYGTPEFFEGAQAAIDKDNVVKEQLDLPQPEVVPGNPDMQMVKFDLSNLAIEKGEELSIYNVGNKNSNGVGLTDINIGFVMK